MEYDDVIQELRQKNCDMRHYLKCGCVIDETKNSLEYTRHCNCADADLHVACVEKIGNMKKNYRISWVEVDDEGGELDRAEDIKANTPIEAILLWAQDFVTVEEIKSIQNKMREFNKIEIQAFYSKFDGKFIFTDLNTSKKRYSE